MPKSKTYDEFVEKFKPKLTTDDCYTPPNIYNVIVDFVKNEYNLDPSHFVRPFWPEADYTQYEYKPDDVVVDNPPFSIITQIVQYYDEHHIRYFLFAPTLTIVHAAINSIYATRIILDEPIIYDNGAKVCTSFITNLDTSGAIMKTAPTLNAQIKAIQKHEKTLPKYQYPAQVCTAAMLRTLCRYGIEYSLPRAEAVFVSRLECQRQHKKRIFGGGYLISERAAAERAATERAATERAAAERAAAERVDVMVWTLSDKEKEIINTLHG